MVQDIKWLEIPEVHDYPAALSYLSLLYPATQARDMVDRLKDEAVVSFKSKDVFRASGLSLLGVSNGHVENNLKKINKGTALSPILLVRDTPNTKLIIADGYHRLCAVYALDEDAQIPCQIV